MTRRLRLAVPAIALAVAALPVPQVVGPAVAATPRWRPTSPPATRDAQLVYHAHRRELVLVDEHSTFAWRRGEWVLVATIGPRLTYKNPVVYDAAHRQILALADDGKTWIWDGATWKTKTDGPGVRQRAAIVYDERNRNVVLFGGMTRENRGVRRTGVTTGTALDEYPWRPAGDTWTWNGSSWVKRNVSGPMPRARASIVYDAARRKVVLFGGYIEHYEDIADTGVRTNADSIDSFFGYEPTARDTWTWDGAAWREAAQTGPEPRADALMKYDPKFAKVVLFGGTDPSGPVDYADTWTWNGTAWTKLREGTPAQRSGATMVYDEARRELLLFGGKTGTTLTADLWAWNGTTWTRQASGPPPREDATAAYDPGLKRVVFFGGNVNLGGPNLTTFNDTWSWDGTRWTALSVPSAWRGAALVYDAARGKVVMFGGVTAAVAPLDETWLWDGRRWSRAATTGPRPAKRSHAMLVYDPVRREVVLFGGRGGPTGLLRDTWTWNGKAWRQREAGPQPPARTHAGIVFDAARKRVVMFGGSDADGGARGDLWLWDGSEWRAGPSGPPARVAPAMVYDPNAGTVVVVSGHKAASATGPTGGALRDTWIWDGSVWRAGPNVAAGHPRATYDAKIKKVVLVGQDCTETCDSNFPWYTRTWDGANWSSDLPNDFGGSSNPSLVYDPVARQTIVFGVWPTGGPTPTAKTYALGSADWVEVGESPGRGDSSMVAVHGAGRSVVAQLSGVAYVRQ